MNRRKKQDTDQKIKSIRVEKADFEPIPPFKSLEEEANFWDTHSIVDRIDDGTLIGFHVANKSKTLTIRFHKNDIQKLREEAFKKGMGITTLARMWIKEKLQTTRS